MTINRSFRSGKQSEQLMNEDMFNMYQMTRYLSAEDMPSVDNGDVIADGALWLSRSDNYLYKYNAATEMFEKLYADELQRQYMMYSPEPPKNPEYGSVWINNGMMMWFDGDDWTPASNPTDGTWNSGIREEFRKINLTEADISDDSGSTVKYLVSPGRYRVYYKGKHVDYVTGNHIYISKSIYEEGHHPTIIHIDERRLMKVQRYIIAIDSMADRIDIDLTNRELFGFRTRDMFGRSLMNQKSNVTYDYRNTERGIELSSSAMAEFDFIYVVEYVFGAKKAKGAATYGDLGLEEIYSQAYRFEEALVFANGFAVGDDAYEVSPNGLIKFNDEDLVPQNDAYDIEILSTRISEHGQILASNGEYGFIRPRNHFENPLYFVNGILVADEDIIIDEERGLIMVLNAIPGMHYLIVDMINRADFLKSGYTQNGFIDISDVYNEIRQQDDLLIFVSGMIVPKAYLSINHDHKIIDGGFIPEGLDYYILRDLRGRNYKKSAAGVVGDFVMGKKEALVFIDGHLITPMNQLYVRGSNRSIKGKFHGQLRIFVEGEEEKPLTWNRYLNKWEDIHAIEITDIENTFNGYSQSGADSVYSAYGQISITAPISIHSRAKCYSYVLADELIMNRYIGTVNAEDGTLDPDTGILYLELMMDYVPKKNNLQVYYNGIRLYDRNDFTQNYLYELYEGMGVVEHESGEVIGVYGIEEGTLTYVIELPPEDNMIMPREDTSYEEYMAYYDMIYNTKSCERELLTKADMVTSNPGLYKTTKPLYPGTVVMYIDGIRQPRDAYTIVDNYRLKLKDRFVPTGHMDEYLTDQNGEEVPYMPVHDSIILIEVRQTDLAHEDVVRETVGVEQLNTKLASEIEFSKEEHKLDKDLFRGLNTILIYINGLFYGLKENVHYVVHEDSERIIIIDPAVARDIYSDDLFELVDGDLMMIEKLEALTDKTMSDIRNRKVTNTFIIDWR